MNLQHMHNLGVKISFMKIMHRDLKPDNIMFRKENDFSSLCLIDFGLSTLIDVQRCIFFKLTSFMYARCGTPGFVAPEILNLKDKHQLYT